MTVLLILFTLILFLAFDHVIQKKKAAALNPAAVRHPVRDDVPDGVAIALNHLWVKGSNGVVTMGIDGFLKTFLGAVRVAGLPQTGAVLTPGTPDIVLGEGEKALHLAPPVAGTVLAVNTRVLEDPALASRDPYGDGWLVKLAVEPQGNAVVRLFSAAKGTEWIRRQITLAKEFLATQGPVPAFATMQDGGVPVDGILSRYDAEIWNAFEGEFTSLGEQTNSGKGHTS